MAAGRCRAIIILGALLFLGGTTAARSDRGERPAIVRVRLYVEGGHLACDVASTGIFSERIVGTVQSGLPAVIELFYQLMASNDGTVTRGVHSYSLRYDVWDDVYSITEGDSVIHFSTFEEMRRLVEHLRGVALIPAHEMRAEKWYSMRVSLAVNPLTGTDRQKITGWVRENLRSSQDDSWKEQVFSVSDLIAHFFSQEKDSPNRSNWYQTELFRPEALPARGSKSAKRENPQGGHEEEE
jgi:hypothetical protein